MFTTRSGSAAGVRMNIHQWTTDHAREIERIAGIDQAALAEWQRFTQSGGARPLDRSRVDASPYFHVHTRNLWRFFRGPLIDGRGLLTANFDPGSDFDLGIYAHHMFVAEIAHELFE